MYKAFHMYVCFLMLINVNINTIGYLIDLYQVYMYCFAIK